MPSLTRHEHGHLAHAIFHELFDAANLMLRLGFNPSGPGIDGGTALAPRAGWAACGWSIACSRTAACRSTPATPRTRPLLGWAAFGSVHRCAPGADYAAVAERLVAAGATSPPWATAAA